MRSMRGELLDRQQMDLLAQHHDYERLRAQVADLAANQDKSVR